MPVLQSEKGEMSLTTILACSRWWDSHKRVVSFGLRAGVLRRSGSITNHNSCSSTSSIGSMTALLMMDRILHETLHTV